jgi:hypothetical protein
MAVIYSKWPLNIPTNFFFIPRPSNINPNLDFWFENIPSGNPGLRGETSEKLLLQVFFYCFNSSRQLDATFSMQSTWHGDEHSVNGWALFRARPLFCGRTAAARSTRTTRRKGRRVRGRGLRFGVTCERSKKVGHAGGGEIFWKARGMAERGGDRDEVFSLGFGLILLLLILLRCCCCYCCCCTFCGFACGFCFLFDVFILVVYIWLHAFYAFLCNCT